MQWIPSRPDEPIQRTARSTTILQQCPLIPFEHHPAKWRARDIPNCTTPYHTAQPPLRHIRGHSDRARLKLLQKHVTRNIVSFTNKERHIQTSKVWTPAKRAHQLERETQGSLTASIHHPNTNSQTKQPRKSRIGTIVGITQRSTEKSLRPAN